MDPLTAGLLVGGATTIGSGLMGADQAKQGQRAAKEAAMRALAEYAGISIPTIAEQSLILQNPDLVGLYNPDQEQLFNLANSSMEGISTDPLLEQQQMQSLGLLGEVAQGGLTEGDKAASRDIQREVGQNAEARRQAILQNMAQRGTLGSGMELAAQLQGQQQAADMQAKASDALQQQAQARALQAMTQSGNMAGQIRSQQFGEKSDVARAQDAIKQFNTANQQNVSSRNTQEQNRAQQSNLAAKQAQENARAQLANQQQQYNKQLLQQQFNNQMQLGQSRANAHMGVGSAAQAAANQNAQIIGGVGSGIANIAGSYFAGQAQQKKPGQV